MEGFLWKTLLLVGALSASGRSAPSPKLLTYDEAVVQAVVNYNGKAKEGSLYQLLEAAPQPDWDPNFEGTQELKFTIKETVCRAEEEGSLDKCDFKEDGVVRDCTATYFLGEKTPVAFLDCKAVGETEEEEEEVEEKEEGTEEEESVERSRKRIKKRRRIRVQITVKITFKI
ncbi:PREDICTED: cathelicidin-related peptide Oh-Cath-like [Thamnophis sirtalis]|uniref:Vipericidin n=1 Tax=Thamnophis sirtalis TaxID=35019 RepID=A0A6I9YV49_9SAUR|nr:PREDICTED: cathelicidin-related peptide Oh-Cath-like [Thamnophis sirtalis]